ncbi:hypothetical protein [Bacillus nitratireducens]|nr:hypothetical protein [Bacillus nitratireducens]
MNSNDGIYFFYDRDTHRDTIRTFIFIPIASNIDNEPVGSVLMDNTGFIT